MDTVSSNNWADQSNNPLLQRILKFVAACRRVDMEGEYPHVGDIQWWFSDTAVADPAHWHFWQDAQGKDIGVCLAEGKDIQTIAHPTAKNDQLIAAMHLWGKEHLADLARTSGQSEFEVNEEVYSDIPASIERIEAEGFTRTATYYLRYRRNLDGTLFSPELPEGFMIGHMDGSVSVADRARLHRDSFYPYSSKTLDLAIAKYQRVMQLPGYDPALDLIIFAADGTLAAGGICWMDRENQIGLFEPLGTRPAFRRLGLATALMAAGIRRLQARGADSAYATAVHAADETTTPIPQDFTVSQLVFQAVGFKLVRKAYIYRKTYPV